MRCERDERREKKEKGAHQRSGPGGRHVRAPQWAARSKTSSLLTQDAVLLEMTAGCEGMEGGMDVKRRGWRMADAMVGRAAGDIGKRKVATACRASEPPANTARQQQVVPQRQRASEDERRGSERHACGWASAQTDS